MSLFCIQFHKARESALIDFTISNRIGECTAAVSFVATISKLTAVSDLPDIIKQSCDTIFAVGKL